jgi:hypothetical protein
MQNEIQPLCPAEVESVSGQCADKPKLTRCEKPLDVRLEQAQLAMWCEEHHEADSFLLKLDVDTNPQFDKLDSYNLSILAYVWIETMSHLKVKLVSKDENRRPSRLAELLESIKKYERWCRGYSAELLLFLWLWTHYPTLKQRYNSYFGEGRLSLSDFTFFERGGKELKVAVRSTPDEKSINYRERDFAPDKIPDYLVAVYVVLNPLSAIYWGAMTKEKLVRCQDNEEKYPLLPGNPDYRQIPRSDFKLSTLLKLIKSTDTIEK